MGSNLPVVLATEILHRIANRASHLTGASGIFSAWILLLQLLLGDQTQNWQWWISDSQPLPCHMHHLAVQWALLLYNAVPEHSLHNQYFAVERIQLILNYRLANLSLPVQLENKQPHLISCMYVFPAYSLALPWHFNSSRRLLACQQWSIALTLSLNYTITLLCTVVWAIKHLKYFKQIHFKGLKEKRHNPTLIQTTC